MPEASRAAPVERDPVAVVDVDEVAGPVVATLEEASTEGGVFFLKSSKSVVRLIIEEIMD